MKATAELQVIPLGAGVSVREEVSRVVALLQAHDFLLETHASGTNIEGDLDAILAAVQQVHETLHAEGAARLVSYLKLETRTDKTPGKEWAKLARTNPARIQFVDDCVSSALRLLRQHGLNLNWR